VPKTNELKSLLTKTGISSKVDNSGGSVGKRYARTDEMGIRYAFTIDHDTLQDNTVTLREIMTTQQVRIPIPEAPSTMIALTTGSQTWTDILAKYPIVEAKKE
jgi:glycyl-tRNA synthetase